MRDDLRFLRQTHHFDAQTGRWLSERAADRSQYLERLRRRIEDTRRQVSWMMRELKAVADGLMFGGGESWHLVSQGEECARWRFVPPIEPRSVAMDSRRLAMSPWELLARRPLGYDLFGRTTDRAIRVSFSIGRLYRSCGGPKQHRLRGQWTVDISQWPVPNPPSAGENLRQIGFLLIDGAVAERRLERTLLCEWIGDQAQ